MANNNFNNKFNSMRKNSGITNKEEETSLKSDSNITLDLIQKPTTILDQIPSYNMNSLDNFIGVMNIELKDQEQINKILKNKNSKKSKKEIETFIDENDTKINEQLETLLDVSNKLKKIISENETLKNEDEEYQTLIQSEKCIKIAEKMREIKKHKNDIIFFLQEKGVNL